MTKKGRRFKSAQDVVERVLSCDISDAELARRSGYDRSCISKWRSGQGPTLNAFLAVAHSAGFYVSMKRMDAATRHKTSFKQDVVKITTENP